MNLVEIVIHPSDVIREFISRRLDRMRFEGGTLVTTFAQRPLAAR